MLRALVAEAGQAGVRDRIVCVFADLGGEDEWEGARELSESHSRHYGVRFVVMCREVDDGHGGRRPQGLLEYIALRRGMWPDAANRFCTSDTKRAPIMRLITRLVAEAR